MLRQFLRDFSYSSVNTGLIAVLVSYAGPLIIVFQAAQIGGLSDTQVASWIWAISFGSAATGIILSLRFKLPVVTAWSTPGAAILVGSLAIYPFEQAISAFLVSGVLVTLLGFSSYFQNLVAKIPQPLASAMLAGILFQFGLNLISAIEALPYVALPMVVIFFLGRRFFPTFSIMMALAYGVGASVLLGAFAPEQVVVAIVVPELTTPVFSLGATVGIGLPLFLVTITSQNIPGLAVLDAAGYKDLPTKSILRTTGIVSVILAPFGAHGINLAAITAAICTGPESHQDAGKRYVAGVFCGLFYLIFGFFGASVASLIFALPSEFVAGIAGIALLSAMANGLSASMSSPKHREPALVTFLVTASGLVVFGIGAAFWGLLAGSATLLILRTDTFEMRKRSTASQEKEAAS